MDPFTDDVVALLENILKFVERLLFLASMTVVHRVFFFKHETVNTVNPFSSAQDM